MNIGASMTAKRFRQPENEESHFFRGLLIGIPAAIILWGAAVWLWSCI